MSDMQAYFAPTQGYFSGIFEYMNGPQAKQATFLQSIPRRETPEIHTHIELAINHGQIRASQDINRGDDSNLITQDGFIRKRFELPFFSDKTVITASEMLMRMPWARPFTEGQSIDIEEAQKYWVKRKLAILHSRIQTAMEKMMSEMLIEGKLKLNSMEDIDFGRDSELAMDAPKPWNIGRDHNSLEDIGNLAMKVSQISGVEPTSILMDSKTFVMMQNSIFFESMANYTNSPIRTDISEMKSRGAAFCGTIIAGGKMLDIWTYDKFYYDENNRRKQFIPTGNVVIGNFSENSEYVTWYFGATELILYHTQLAQQLGIDYEDAMEDIRQGEIVPGVETHMKRMEVTLESCFACIPSDINVFGVLNATP